MTLPLNAADRVTAKDAHLSDVQWNALTEGQKAEHRRKAHSALGQPVPPATLTHASGSTYRTPTAPTHASGSAYRDPAIQSAQPALGHPAYDTGSGDVRVSGVPGAPAQPDRPDVILDARGRAIDQNVPRVQTDAEYFGISEVEWNAFTDAERFSYHQQRPLPTGPLAPGTPSLPDPLHSVALPVHSDDPGHQHPIPHEADPADRRPNTADGRNHPGLANFNSKRPSTP